MNNKTKVNLLTVAMFLGYVAIIGIVSVPIRLLLRWMIGI